LGSPEPAVARELNTPVAAGDRVLPNIRTGRMLLRPMRMNRWRTQIGKDVSPHLFEPIEAEKVAVAAGAVRRQRILVVSHQAALGRASDYLWRRFRQLDSVAYFLNQFCLRFQLSR